MPSLSMLARALACNRSSRLFYMARSYTQLFCAMWRNGGGSCPASVDRGVAAIKRPVVIVLTRENVARLADAGIGIRHRRIGARENRW